MTPQELIDKSMRGLKEQGDRYFDGYNFAADADGAKLYDNCDTPKLILALAYGLLPPLKDEIMAEVVEVEEKSAQNEEVVTPNS